jgi:5'-deoxynucleotidase YfbR-like HD superfamily hydrolase
MNIEAIRKSNLVRRFHTCERIREETVGHHSANVAALVLYLEPDAPRELLIAALMHDWPEQYTGDIPAPAKWGSPQLADALAQAEAVCWPQLGVTVPPLHNHHAHILKLADLLDLMLSCSEEMRRGNVEASAVYNNGAAALSAMSLSKPLRCKVRELLKEIEL